MRINMRSKDGFFFSSQTKLICCLEKSPRNSSLQLLHATILIDCFFEIYVRHLCLDIDISWCVCVSRKNCAHEDDEKEKK